MKLCFVIQRYGLETTGGAEMHCRWLASRLARTHEVEVATTCALDYIQWKNHYPPGRDVVDGIPVTRYKVRRPRNERVFALTSDIVFRDAHTPADEVTWVEENGPQSPALVEALPSMRHVDLFLFYSYRYYQSYFGLPKVADRAVLVPTAEEDPAIHLGIFRSFFRSPRGILYLTPEEQDLVQGVSDNAAVPSVVIGSGLDIAAGWETVDVRAQFGLPADYLLYLGRLDRNKGVDKLLAYYLKLAAEWPEAPPLVLAGKPVIPIPEHPKIRHLGFVSDQEKYALLAGCGLLIMPSAYESLSIIVLEAWAMGRPVLVNAECRVLEGQCIRSGGGLFYRGYAEFAPSLKLLVERADLRAGLGTAGRRYVSREYDWNVVEERTNGFLSQVSVAKSKTRDRD